MERPVIKVWVTKYALTTGIFEAMAEICEDINVNMISLRRDVQLPEHFHGKDWHRSKENAIKRAYEMVEAKKKSLIKQMAQLDKLTF